MPRPPRSSKLTIARARSLARAGKSQAARQLVAQLPPGTVVIEVNQTSPDPAAWPSKRRA